jgi:hypothetical protein
VIDAKKGGMIKEKRVMHEVRAILGPVKQGIDLLILLGIDSNNEMVLLNLS